MTACQRPTRQSAESSVLPQANLSTPWGKVVEGGFTGVGYLEPVSGNGGLRLISPVAEPPKALRLGSVRLEESFRAKRVDLRNLFGTE